MARHLVSCLAMLAIFAVLAIGSRPHMTAVEEPALRYAIGPLGAGFLTLGLVSAIVMTAVGLGIFWLGAKGLRGF